MHHAHIGGQAAGDADNRFVVPFRHPRDADRHLALQRLAVDTPFTGNHQRRIFHQLLQPQRFGDNFDSLAQLGAAKRLQTGAHSAGRAGAGHPIDILIQIALNNVGIMF